MFIDPIVSAESQEYAASELMLNDCVHDIKELINCVDCYKHSNEKINNNWFCLPCRKPHNLVWAKQKGYPYWPAKVIIIYIANRMAYEQELFIFVYKLRMIVES